MSPKQDLLPVEIHRLEMRPESPEDGRRQQRQKAILRLTFFHMVDGNSRAAELRSARSFIPWYGVLHALTGSGESISRRARARRAAAGPAVQGDLAKTGRVCSDPHPRSRRAPNPWFTIRRSLP